MSFNTFQYSDIIIWPWNLDLECEVQPILLVYAYESSSLAVHIKCANIYLLADGVLFIDIAFFTSLVAELFLIPKGLIP